MVEQGPDGGRDIANGPVEGFGIRDRWFGETGDLPDKLQRGSLNLGFGGRGREMVEGTNVPTHGSVASNEIVNQANSVRKGEFPPTR